MRDKNKPIEYWEELVQFFREDDQKVDYFASYQEKMRTSEHIGPLNSLFSLYTEGWMEQVCYRYSRGDDLSMIRTEIIDEGVNRYLKLVGEIERYKVKMEMPRTMFYPTIIEPHQVQSVYTLLSWLICFDVSAEVLTELERYIAPEGKDRIVDTVLAGYRPERVIADSCACPRTHGLLDAMIDADDERRVTLAAQYLQRWGKLMSTLKGLAALGGAGRAKGAKNNADLLTLSENPSYKGFWAWDLALMVRTLGIDDSSFAEHELYPSDLAHFSV